MPYQHYQAYSSHYPQAAYPTHYQPYAAPPTPHAQTPTPAMSRQPITAQQQQANNSGIDTADIATLNDALGSAGVDLRVRLFSRSRTSFRSLSGPPFRPKRKRSKDHMSSINLTDPTRTARANKPRRLPLTPDSSEQQCGH